MISQRSNVEVARPRHQSSFLSPALLPRGLRPRGRLQELLGEQARAFSLALFLPHRYRLPIPG
jgi:hypothetical protein